MKRHRNHRPHNLPALVFVVVAVAVRSFTCSSVRFFNLKVTPLIAHFHSKHRSRDELDSRLHLHREELHVNDIATQWLNSSALTPLNFPTLSTDSFRALMRLWSIHWMQLLLLTCDLHRPRRLHPVARMTPLTRSKSLRWVRPLLGHLQRAFSV